MRVLIVIPAYNEEATVGAVVHQTMIHNSRFMIQAIVVDDGSTDHTADVARAAGALVLRHPINRGLGAALATGIEAALRILYNAPQPPLKLRGGEGGVIVTLDADGQHDPAEIPRVIEPIVKGEVEVVIGSRFKVSGVRCPRTRASSVRGRQVSGVPLARQIANFFGNFFTWLLFGIWVSDSQSGFRAFSADAARQLRLRTSTMEVSSEIIREVVRLKLKMVEVPIIAHYTNYSLSKGQGFRQGLDTLWKLIALRFFR